jgi:hypothetical protein
MNRKETMLMTIVGMAVLTTVTTMSSSTQALALGHWNTDEDYTLNSGLAEDSMDSSGTSDNPNGNDEGNEEDSTTAVATGDDDEGNEEDSNEDTSIKSTDDGDEDKNGITEDVSTDDTEEDEDEEDQEDEE